jgi:hypothetical protein
VLAVEPEEVLEDDDARGDAADAVEEDDPPAT